MTACIRIKDHQEKFPACFTQLGTQISKHGR